MAEEYNPFAVPLGPYAERVTGRKTTAKQKGDKPRDLNVRVKPKAAISRPNQGYVRRAQQAVSRAVPSLEPFVQDVEGLLGPAEFEDALSRALPALLGQDVYRGNADLAGEDASLFAINALAGPAFGLAGKGIKKVAGMVPASVREGVSDLAARAGRYLRDVPGAPLRDADYVEGLFNVMPEGVSDFAARPTAQGQRRISTTYREPMALPAPGPGLPPFAAKPRGGQWWADSPYLDANLSPEKAAREGAEALGLKTMRWEPEVPGDLRRYLNPKAVETSPEQQWLERALAKYYKTEFGSPTDPLRSLAERGLHYDPEMTPERWQQTVNDYLMEDRLQDILLPPNPQGGMRGAGDDLRGAVMTTMPWLAKQPVTDKLYGISKGGLDLEHFTDEFYNALNPELSGLPADLAVRPEMLERMSFPQAVERVGRINQFRAKQMEEAALSAMDSPAIQVFKEYSENNPRGLRWVELRVPEEIQDTSNYDIYYDPVEEGYVVTNPTGHVIGVEPDRDLAEELAAKDADYDLLEEALRYEGDTMGHCVGGYCDDVIGGRSRIFSLRDAKGEPHVTVEVAPGAQRKALADIPPDALDQITAAAKADTDSVTGPMGIDPSDLRWIRTYQTNLSLKQREWLRDNPTPSDIVQIKGKQNRAPNDEYLPFVQDFVKSQQWGNVGDLGNTGLVRLPDGRYITRQQLDDVINSEGLDDAYQSYDFNANGFPRDPSRLGPEDWQQFSRHFEGYAVGGRVDANRCFCHNPLSVKRKTR